MKLAADALAPLLPECLLCVAIPAKNESRYVEAALRALQSQRDLAGSPLDPRTYETIVLCNDCEDATASRARAFGARNPEFRLHVLEATLPREAANVGTARRALLDLAAERFLRAQKPLGVVATSDADSSVDRCWVAHTLREMSRADVVAGHVVIAPEERIRMLAPLRLAYDREVAYRRLLGAVEARFDPRPYDPGPHHDALVGASFAVTARTYVAAGGLPPLPRHEDWEFALALQRIDARVRHSFDVVVRTSARRDGRVSGGFASLLETFAVTADAARSQMVRCGRAAIEEASARALLRVLRCDDSVADREQLALVSELLGIEARTILDLRRASSTFGAFWLDVVPLSRQRRYPEEPVDDAIADMRRALASASAAAPTRSITASGAG